MRSGSYRLSERERAIIGLTKLGIREDDVRGILRDARTLARLAEASCNGDWPCDNGERKTRECPRCGSGFHPSAFRWSEQTPARLRNGRMSISEAVGTGYAEYKTEGTPALMMGCAPNGGIVNLMRICIDCRTAERIEARLRPYAPQGVGVELAGDPRGYVVKVFGIANEYQTEVGIA